MKEFIKKLFTFLEKTNADNDLDKLKQSYEKQIENCKYWYDKQLKQVKEDAEAFYAEKLSLARDNLIKGIQNLAFNLEFEVCPKNKREYGELPYDKMIELKNKYPKHVEKLLKDD